MDKKREKKVIQDIFAITSHCLLCGELPTDREKLLQLFQNVEATDEEILQLAKENKLYWVYDIYHNQNKEEYNKTMNISLAHYLEK
jgi:hypothetical protein